MGSFRVLVERRRADPITAEFLSVASSAIRLRALRFSPFRDHGRSAQSRNRPVPGGTAFAVRSLGSKGEWLPADRTSAFASSRHYPAQRFGSDVPQAAVSNRSKTVVFARSRAHPPTEKCAYWESAAASPLAARGMLQAAGTRHASEYRDAARTPCAGRSGTLPN
jgi:hypothetical protein